MYLQIECTHCHSSLNQNKTSTHRKSICINCKNQEDHLLASNSKSKRVAYSKDIQITEDSNQLNIHLEWNKSVRSPYKPFSFRQVMYGILTFLALQTTMGFAFALGIPILYVTSALLCLLWFYTFVYQPLPFLFNTIKITVGAQFITVNYGPLPNLFQYGKHRFAVKDIQQLYIRRSKKKNQEKKKSGNLMRFV